ncbi:MAG TPA: hypothetical protein VEO20_05645 [Thermoplasmata archaeon]|nr:hypothetical protein [Thermoplasmata archaeon]
MGRSVARFLLPGQTAAGLLQAANAYGGSAGMKAGSWSPNHVTLVKGSIWVTGKRVLTVSAWDSPGGANVQVEAYVEGLTEFSADPKSLVGALPRRDMWRIASAFVASLRVNPDVVFVHA